MRFALAGLAALSLVAGCSKAPSAAAPATSTPAAAPAPTPQPSAGPAVSGVYTAAGQPAALTYVSAHADDPFNGQPVTALLFTVKPQDEGTSTLTTLTGAYGDAIIVRVLPDGRPIGEDLVHHGLDKTGGHLSGAGIVTLMDYKNAGGQISGHLTSNGPTDEFAQSVNVDLTFHTKAP